jgi:4a-hydroxytetrahydrobiopterin dehydratase
MVRRKVTDEELAEALQRLPGWEVKEDKLHKEFKFGSFAEAMGWMVSSGIQADKMDHHPEWANVYSRVTVDLVTHDLGALSTLDVALAEKMEELASN